MCAAASEPPGRCKTLEVSAEAASILLSFAMRETEAPAVELGEALQRLAHGLRPLEGGIVREALAGDIAACVRALQFHDRLMQQLAVIRNLLTRITDHPLPQMAGFGAMRWEELLTALREQLADHSHHDLFELLLRTGGVAPGAAVEQAEGTCELF